MVLTINAKADKREMPKNDGKMAEGFDPNSEDALMIRVDNPT
jgi:hypothetical protein